MIRTVVIGAAGKMGRMLVCGILKDPGLKLVGAVEVPGCPALGQDAGVLAGLLPCGISLSQDLAAVAAQADAVIDFSAPAAAVAHARLGVAAGCVVVLGTTGLQDPDRQELQKLAATGRLVVAPNMSVGVNLLFNLCSRLPQILGPDYDIEVVEMHHNQKKDAPSGTAVRLAEILATASGLDYQQAARHGRQGMVGARTPKEIGLHAVRGGDVVGDHTIIFATNGERVELTHKASSRETFAHGALRAVKFLAAAAPGLYDMQDVLGLRR